jgi:hypothetical protein
MKRAFLTLPGPIPVKVVLAIVIITVGLIVLFFTYEWMGENLLDNGGTLG